jgi:hypothetical protein
MPALGFAPEGVTCALARLLALHVVDERDRVDHELVRRDLSAN